jgi:hypothetical protein
MARLHLKETEVGSAAAMVTRYRPRAIVMTHALYATDPLRFDAMASEAAAKIVRLDGEDVDDTDLVATFRAVPGARTSSPDLRACRASHPAPELGPAPVAATAVQQIFADESLRGSLTANGYGPILDWATERAASAVQHVAARAEAPEGASMVASLLANLVRAAVRSAEVGEVSELLTRIDACPRPVIDRELAKAALSRLPLDDEPDENALAVAAALGAATPMAPF